MIRPIANSREPGFIVLESLLVAAWLILCSSVPMTVARAAQPPPRATDGGPEFSTPQQGLHALLEAVKTGDPRIVARLFGTKGKQLLTKDKVQDRRELAHFAEDLEAGAQLERRDTRYTLLVGKDRWPFPIPIVKRGDGWVFDTDAGLQEILDRRIGDNELAAIATCRAYAVAQWEYYTESGSDTQGLAVYARRLFSTPGRRDGLYWATARDEPPSPLGALVAEAREEGYGPPGHAGQSRQRHRPRPLRGYIFKILTAQGPSAPGGAFSYIINGNMIAGYGLVAYPSKWGSSGIMTFIINQQGRVYQKNLGPDTGKLAAAMTEYDPDPSWQLVEE